MLGITVIGYDEQGHTVVNIPDLREIERLGVTVKNMPRDKHGKLEANQSNGNVQGRAVLTVYHPVGYTYRNYRNLLRTLKYAGNVLRNSTQLDFCKNHHADYKWAKNGNYGKCVHCGAKHHLGYETDGHQMAFMFTPVN